MDQGLYNKHTKPRGDHGTLIGNWQEESVLQRTTGFARYEDLSLEKKAMDQTTGRILPLSSDSNLSVADRYTSVTHHSFPVISTEHFQPKIFNQTGSHWHHQQQVDRSQLKGKQKDFSSQIKLGEFNEPLSSITGSTYAPPHILQQDRERTPLRLRLDAEREAAAKRAQTAALAEQ